jgi:hypothetical protein
VIMYPSASHMITFDNILEPYPIRKGDVDLSLALSRSSKYSSICSKAGRSWPNWPWDALQSPSLKSALPSKAFVVWKRSSNFRRLRPKVTHYGA